MTPDQITQLRELLNKARKVFWHEEGWTWYRVCTAEVLPLIDQALALLPCPTCDGTKKIVASGYWGMLHKEVPCPDCK